MQPSTVPRGAHLVGSVPLADAEEVFMTACGELGRHLRRLPDGETGERLRYTNFQADLLGKHPQFKRVPATEEGRQRPLVALRREVSPEDIQLDNLGYAGAAIGSYQIFARLKENGTIPHGCRFMVAIPSPGDPVPRWVVRQDQDAVLPAYKRATLQEVKRICTAIPHDQLAVQWDAPAAVVGLHWGDTKTPSDTDEAIIERLVEAGEAVPDDVELGYHWCYGNIRARGRGLTDTSEIVRLTNATMDGVSRTVEWIHVPVPQQRNDEAYFAPLKQMRLRPETELYLGLVHHEDGMEGAAGRIKAAQTAVTQFGIASECGLGRLTEDVVLSIFGLHKDIARPIR